MTWRAHSRLLAEISASAASMRPVISRCRVTGAMASPGCITSGCADPSGRRDRYTGRATPPRHTDTQACHTVASAAAAHPAPSPRPRAAPAPGGPDVSGAGDRSGCEAWRVVCMLFMYKTTYSPARPSGAERRYERRRRHARREARSPAQSFSFARRSTVARRLKPGRPPPHCCSTATRHLTSELRISRE